MRRIQMEVFEAIRNRHSVRSYLSDEVPDGKSEKILKAAHLAPSAGNIQPWHFIVVADQQKRKKLSRGRYAKFLVESPVVLVGCGDKKSVSQMVRRGYDYCYAKHGFSRYRRRLRYMLDWKL